MILSRNKENNVYICTPKFYFIKVGFKGVNIYIDIYRYIYIYIFFFFFFFFFFFQTATRFNIPHFDHPFSCNY